MHFLISQLLAQIYYEYLLRSGRPKDAFYRASLPLTALAGLLSIVILLPSWRRDVFRRRATGIIPRERASLSASRSFLLFFMGSGLAYYANVLLALLRPLLPDSSYFSQMDLITQGKAFLFLILLVGILSPIAEEVVFRQILFLRLRDRHGLLFSVAISSLLFGLYHGNLYQAIYASLMGAFFALALEYTGNLMGSILLHVGANCFSLALSQFPYQLLLPPLETYFLVGTILLAILTIQGFKTLSQEHAARGGKRLI